MATAATAPYAIYHFNRMSDYGLVANLLAVPLTSFWVMPWAVAAFLLMPLGLESLALTPMGWGIDGVNAIARIVAAWPGAVTLVPAMPLASLGLISVGGLWLCLWRRPWRVAGLAGIAAGFVSISLVTPPDLLIGDDGKLMALRATDGRLLLSSKRELRADAVAAGVVDPHDLADALIRLDRAAELVEFHASPATEPLYTVSPFDEAERVTRMFATHPPLAERVSRLRNLGEGRSSERNG